ncbi:glycosyltransferase family 2 protein [Rhodococcus triatomae]|nr:hypothetical protein G419_04073 [Rhodococcus triatomae BKS 15-14]
MNIAVVTVVAGRHHHLRHHIEALDRSDRPPDDHIVVSMGDPDVAAVVTATGHPAHVEYLDVRPPLPLAAARNAGAAAALARGHDLLIFLDVDCLALPRLVSAYAAGPHDRALLCGPVTYLAPEPASGYPLESLDRLRNPHPARPDPPDGTIETGNDHDLFWSLSFAVSARVWTRIGGFCTDYRGYGAEDTDFGQRARAAGVPVCWVGGADAFHQFHPVSDPPIEHLDDILRNAALFHRRWQRWPMRGWLEAFERRGLVRFDAGADRWTRTTPSR